MSLLKWPRRVIVVCRGETAPEVALREADNTGLASINLPDRLSRAPLTPKGLDAARDAGKRLFAAGIRLNSVFVAPDLAARQTAAQALRAIGFDPEPDLPAARSLIKSASGGQGSRFEGLVADPSRLLASQVELQQDERLRDRDLGSWAGLTESGIRKAVSDAFPLDPGALYQRPTGGESHADVALRVRSFLSELGREYAGETLLVVTHRSVFAAIHRVLAPVADEGAERELERVLEGQPPWEIYDSRGPVARQFILQGYYRMADLAQTGARNAISRMRRRGEEEEESGPSYPVLPAAPVGQVKGRVLITYLSAGNGHRIAAQAIEADIKQRYPGIEVRTPEDLAHFSRPGKWGATLFYRVIDWHIYHRLYELADRVPARPEKLNFLRQELMQLLSRQFTKMVKELKPDVVIHTHPLGTELLAGGIADGKLPRHISNYQVVTDCYGHSFYVLPGVDATFVPNREVADQLVDKGLLADRIFVTGIPIHPAFAEKPDQKVVRAEFGISQASRSLLVQGNLIDDVKHYDQLMEHLIAAFPAGVHGLEVEVLVCCGKNAKLFHDLTNLARGYTNKVRLRPYGMLTSPQMRDIMRSADLSLTKPGGLTTAESIAMELPMVLLEVMGGGQEGYNATYFEREGVGVAVYDFEESLRQVAELLDNPEGLQAMRVACNRIASPTAASSIADVVANSVSGSTQRAEAWGDAARTSPRRRLLRRRQTAVLENP